MGYQSVKNKMVTRKEYYKKNRKEREALGTTRTKCKDCGCYIKGRHKVWCNSEEANFIRKQRGINNG